MPVPNSTITITVAGPPRCGKTSIALVLQSLFGFFGLECTYEQDELNPRGLASKREHLLLALKAIREAKTKIVIKDLHLARSHKIDAKLVSLQADVENAFGHVPRGKTKLEKIGSGHFKKAIIKAIGEKTMTPKQVTDAFNNLYEAKMAESAMLVYLREMMDEGTLVAVIPLKKLRADRRKRILNNPGSVSDTKGAVRYRVANS